jgi:hypothetical protein
MEIFINRTGPGIFWVVIYGQWSAALFRGEIHTSTPIQAVKQALEQMEEKNATS